MEFVLQQMHAALMALMSCEANDIVATRGRIRWRYCGDSRSDMIRRREDENDTFCARSFLLDGVPFWNYKRVSNAGRPTCLAARRR